MSHEGGGSGVLGSVPSRRNNNSQGFVAEEQVSERGECWAVSERSTGQMVYV